MRVVHSTSWKFQTEALAGILTAPKGCLRVMRHLDSLGAHLECHVGYESNDVI